MIHAEGVTKCYGKLLANDRVTIDILPGETAVLLGPNGAGKSTIIKSICGLLRFEGRITIGGYGNTTVEAKRLLGYVPEFPVVYPLLTAAEHLEFIARAYRLRSWEERAGDLLRRFDLEDNKRKLGKELSKGMQQKLSVCCALLPEPRALILDEPLVGLDPRGIRELKAIMTELKKSGCALLVSTHMIESMEENWDITCIMVKGRIVRACRRGDLAPGENLEGVYFAITEGQALPPVENGAS
ncbi:MAG: ABC transporter ATP-binding protein [Spirochaetaceae bacterium]|jgi:ABC-type multidrug transport system ATPase subunit|nr:ABC transporter ATP-binding protein [Spirochaetaceae bacterium]